MSLQGYAAAVADRMEDGNYCPVSICGRRIGVGWWWCDAHEIIGRRSPAWAELMAVLDGDNTDAARGEAKARVTAEIEAHIRGPAQ